MTETKNNHWLNPLAIGAYLVVFKLFLHFIFNSNYGYFREDAEKNCNSVEEKTEANHPYSMAVEKYKILVCRQTKKPLPEIWQSLKHWN